jgi:hypothetical protein
MSDIMIEHVAVYVHDLEAMREFYQTYFGAKANDQYHNPTTGLRTYFLTFGSGVRLEIMNRPGVDVPQQSQQVGWAHVAFSLGSREAVDKLAQTLADAGFTVSPPRVTGDGYYEAVVQDPEGNAIEITA